MPAALPGRLKIGVDVPWVTSWTQEIQGGVGPCPTVDGRAAALQAWKPGLGKPLYSRNHLRRQRDSARAMLCPMCGEATTAEDRWSQTGRFVAAGALRAKGFGAALPVDLEDDKILLDAGAIAPLHLACANASLQPRHVSCLLIVVGCLCGFAIEWDWVSPGSPPRSGSCQWRASGSAQVNAGAGDLKVHDRRPRSPGLSRSL
eukprot:gene69061-94647_t